MSKLYVVATPIGNLGDITKRAIDAMKEVSYLLVEDTRQTIKLLNHFDIKTKMISYHKFNEKKRSEEIIAKMIMSDIDVALVTDAGTPCISDPGYEIIKEAYKNGVEVIPIPGASAIITALSISGFDTENFCFYGFLPREKKGLENLIEKIKAQDIKIIVLYESPKRIVQSLEKINEYMEDIEVAVFSDLTKLHEKVYRGNITEVIRKLKSNENVEKGEYVIVIRKEKEEKKEENKISVEALLLDLLIKNNLSLKDACKEVTNIYNISRNDTYEAMIRLKELMKEK